MNEWTHEWMREVLNRQQANKPTNERMTECKKTKYGMKKWMNDKRTIDGTNKQMNERTHKRANEWVNKWTSPQRDESMSDWTNERSKGRVNECEWVNETMNPWFNECM